MPAIHPFFHFNGNAEEAFLFYQSVFGGAFSVLKRFKDLTTAGQPFPEKEAHKIMQVALPIGEHFVLMGSDVPDFLGRVNEQEHRSKILVRADTKEQADHFFQGLAAGGAVEIPIGDSPWGTYLGMFRDKYGIEWMVEFCPL